MIFAIGVPCVLSVDRWFDYSSLEGSTPQGVTPPRCSLLARLPISAHSVAGVSRDYSSQFHKAGASGHFPRRSSILRCTSSSSCRSTPSIASSSSVS